MTKAATKKAPAKAQPAPAAEPARQHTPLRAMRLEDDLWADAHAEAAARGENVTKAVRAFLVRYTKPQRTKRGQR